MKQRNLAAAAASLTLIAVAPISAKAQSASDATAGVTSTTPASTDSTHRRPRAIEYSDAYATRLKIHRIGSYAELPLFAAEWYLGDKLLQQNHSDWVKPAHVVVASGLGVLFVTNTVTGVWNLVESNKDPSGRTRRLLHSALMLAGDAGFAYTGIDSGSAKESPENRNRHKNAGLVSFGISTVGTMMMWLWKD